MRCPRRADAESGGFGDRVLTVYNEQGSAFQGTDMDRFDNLRDKILPVLRPYVKRVAIFGSLARGEDTPESDIDILVELRPPEERPRSD